MTDQQFSSRGARLEPALRSFMEARLGADLSEVRIHTGYTAAFLCDLFQARAITRGSDIFFGSGQYAPDTPDGKFLLAHELVHVLQQRAAAARPSPGPMFIGSPDDACEHEADRVATEALTGGVRSAITPDFSGAIRRSITVLDGTANITASYEGAKPGIDHVKRGGSLYATLHLTRNKSLLLRSGRPNPAHAPAIRLTGTVQVIAGPRDDITNAAEFHFIQLFFLSRFKASYAGLNGSAGSIVLDFAGPVSFGGYGRFLLDADPKIPESMPYAEIYSGLRQIDKLTWQATVINDDHPYADVPLMVGNPATGDKNNYLCSVTRQFQVITALVAVDRHTAVIRPLAWIEWGGYCNARMKWRMDESGTPVIDAATVDSAYFNAWDAKQVAPPHRGVAELVTHPPLDPHATYTAMAAKAYRTVIRATSQNTNNREIQTSGPSDPEFAAAAAL